MPEQRRFPLGREIPLLWRRDVDLAWGEEGGAEGQGSGEGGKGKSISPSGADTAAAKVRGEGGMGGVGGVLGEGQVCVVERSDGKLKFAVVKSRSASVHLPCVCVCVCVCVCLGASHRLPL